MPPDTQEATVGSQVWVDVQVASDVPIQNVELTDERGNNLRPDQYVLSPKVQRIYGSSERLYGVSWAFPIYRNEPGSYAFRIRAINEKGEAVDKTFVVIYKDSQSGGSTGARTKALAGEGRESWTEGIAIARLSSRPELVPIASRGKGSVGIMTPPANWFSWTLAAQGRENWWNNHSKSDLQYTSLVQETNDQQVTFFFSSFPLSNGVYFCDRHKVSCATTLWPSNTAGSYYWSVGSTSGTNLSNPNYQSTDVPWRARDADPFYIMTVYTYAYWIKRGSGGQAVNMWYPASPSSMRFNYSVSGTDLYTWQSGADAGSGYAPLNGTPAYFSYGVTLVKNGGTIVSGSTSATVSDNNGLVDTSVHTKTESSTGISGQIKAVYTGGP